MPQLDKVDLSSHALWQNIGRLYAVPGVEEAALRLQDDLGADLLLVLTALALAEEAQSLSSEAWARLNLRLAPWRSQVIERLRTARRWMKKEAELADHPLRDQLKRLELQAERHAIEMLAQLLAETEARPQPQEAALEAAAQGLNLPLEKLMNLARLANEPKGA